MMTTNQFLGQFGQHLYLNLEHDHGTVQAEKLSRIHSVRQLVNMILKRENVCIVGLK